MQVPAYWCSTGWHHTSVIPKWKLQTAMMLHFSAFQVTLPMICSLWISQSLDHFSVTNMNSFCCFIAIAQIALSPSTPLAILSSKHRINQPTLNQDSVPLASDSSKPGLLPTKYPIPVFNFVILTKKPVPALLSQKNILSAWYIWLICANQKKSWHSLFW